MNVYVSNPDNLEDVKTKLPVGEKHCGKTSLIHM